MANISRVRAVLTGFAGGPGVSTFYCLSPGTFLGPLSTFWTAMAQWMPNDVRINIEPYGDVIDSITGDLTGSWTGPAQVEAVGTGAGSYAAPAGAVVNWLTGGVMDGTRLRGRTFVVPLAGDCYDTDGDLLFTILTSLQGTGTGLTAGGAANFVVWHRPIAAGKPRGPRAGGHDLVTSAKVNNRVAVLRSRRG